LAKISLWASEGCLFSSITTIIDSLEIANLWINALGENDSKPLFEIEILTSDGLPVNASGRVPVHPHKSIHEVEETDYVIVAPNFPTVVPMPSDLDEFYQWVVKQRANGATIATVCTGTFLLAEMGLLDGKTATTNWLFAPLFRQTYPDVRLKPEQMVTEDDGIICTGAVTAAYKLILRIISEFGSEKLASACAKTFLIDPGKESQTPYIISVPLKNHGDSQVLIAQTIIEEKFSAIETVDAVAKEVGISPRHFKRRFKQATGELPLKYLQRTRIDAAREMLETTKDSIDEITWSVGYHDVSSFCRLFKKITDLSPKAYRDKFFCGSYLQA
jgi:transcriptional regulator GlxA family with amidase domain